VSSPTLGRVLRQAMAEPIASALHLSPHQWKTLRALAACRTSALGGQLFQCTACEREHFVAHSCRNRHCPQCQGALAVEWLAQQERALLPTAYFHLVFTLPHSLNGLIRQNRSSLFKLLFDAASGTLLKFGQQNLHAQIGVTALLHTWSQTLADHYHLHCIVTGGGVALDDKRWIGSPPHYLFPVKALSQVFRGKFLEGLNKRFDESALEFHGKLALLAQRIHFHALMRKVAASPWVVYSKRPFAGPRQVLAYLSRYTHRVAISNHRLLGANQQSVTFKYKDYADGARYKTMTLDTTEFVRRFCLHILPKRFVKIRHYGLLGNRKREERLAQARQLLGVAPPKPPDCTAENGAITERESARCPFCQKPTLRFVREMEPQRVGVSGAFDSS
jgi:Putative transposase/Transposase zinc-binding domain